MAAVVAAVCLSPQLLPAVDAPTAEQIKQLIERLGHEEFAEREQAGQQLVKLGLPAYKLVEGAVGHQDREIRYRAARILAQIREADLNRRLDEFLKGKDAEGEFPIPSWGLFKKRYEDSAAARQMFVEMQKAEPELLDALEHDPKSVGDQLGQKVVQIQQMMQFQQVQLKLGQVAALIFAGAETTGLNQQTNALIQNYCYQQSFRDAITTGDKRDICRKMLGHWIRQGDETTAYQGMMLAMQYELSEGLTPALKIIEGGNRQPHMAQFAAITVAKFGAAEHRPILEKLLEDKTVVNQMQINNQRIQTQLSDVALASLLHLSKQDPKAFGFDRLQMQPPYLFNVSTLGFENDEKRKAALDKWTAFKEKEAKPPATGNQPAGAPQPAPASAPQPASPATPQPVEKK
jgi:hypothetical protein